MKYSIWGNGCGDDGKVIGGYKVLAEAITAAKGLTKGNRRVWVEWHEGPYGYSLDIPTTDYGDELMTLDDDFQR